MNGGLRILIGIATGALLVLLLHPLASPYTLWPVVQLGPSRVLTKSPLLTANAQQPPPADTLGEVSYWMILAARQIQARADLSPTSLTNLINLAERAREQDPDNAYWLQCLAVLYDLKGDPDKSWAAWRSASTAARWDDYQNWRITSVLKALEKESRAPLAWHAAALYEERSRPIFSVLRRHGVKTITGFPLSTTEGIDRRLVLFRNGRLVMDGCRTVEGGMEGVTMIRSASRQSDGPASESVREELLTRQEFLDRLAAANRWEDRSFVEHTHIRMDSWLALAANHDNQRDREQAVMLAWLIGSIPGSLVLVGLGGLLLYGLGEGIIRLPFLQQVFSPKLAPILGLILGGASFLWTQQWPLALFVTATLAFFAFRPSVVRRMPPDHLPALIQVLLALVSLLGGMMLLAHFVGQMPATVALSETLQPVWDFPLSLEMSRNAALIILVLPLVAAPLLGLQTKSEAGVLAGLILRLSGTTLIAFAAVGILLGVPALVGVDRQLKEKLTRISTNEPGYYMTF